MNLLPTIFIFVNSQTILNCTHFIIIWSRDVCPSQREKYFQADGNENRVTFKWFYIFVVLQVTSFVLLAPTQNVRCSLTQRIFKGTLWPLITYKLYYSWPWNWHNKKILQIWTQLYYICTVIYKFLGKSLVWRLRSFVSWNACTPYEKRKEGVHDMITWWQMHSYISDTSK